MSRRLVALLLLSSAACADHTSTTAPLSSLPSFEIADAARDYKAGFYWLPPMVAQPSHGGAFDAALEPTVEICQLAGSECGSVIATWTTTSGPDGGRVAVDVDDELYQVNWHTDASALSTSALYRISVRAGVHGVLLGFADVQPVSNGSGLRKIDTDEFIGLVDGRTLPIKFRIETNIAGEIGVSPSETLVEPGATQQVTAVVRDLHGNVMDASVIWSSSDETVATVDRMGVVTALAEGSATITATADRVTGTATVMVEGGTVVLGTGADHTCLLDGGRVWCWGEGSLGQLGDGEALDRLSPIAVAGGIGFAALEAGQVHSCALDRGGRAYCWGSDFSGQLGDGGEANPSCPGGQPCAASPIVVAGGHTFASISAGTRNTCALTADGTAYCWGEGVFGAIGNGTLTPSFSPQPVAGDLVFATIDVGADAACAVTTDGVGYCWGRGTSGRLGNGSTANRSTPVAVSGDLRFSTISVGDSHSCGLTTDGQAYCWGLGTFGRLGNGTTTGRLTPAPVSGGLVFASISAGFEHTCAVTTDGRGYCWGANVNGKLGDGTQGVWTTPAPVAGGLAFVSIGAGTGHSCGVTTDDQTYCWGSGSRGQLGNGTNPAASLTPVPISALP